MYMQKTIVFFLLNISFVACKFGTYYGAELRKNTKNIGYSNKQYQFKNEILVNNYIELANAIANAKPNSIISIADTAKIDLTNKPPIILIEGTTLYGGDSRNKKGALLFTTNLGHSPAIQCKGNNIKIIGLRLKGPDTMRRVEQMYSLIAKNEYYSLPYSHGIRCIGFDNLLVENCELWGWSYSAIDLERSKGNVIRNNYIHHNQRLGLGYGVAVHDAYALIENNFFNWNRHSIAGSGLKNTGYEVRNNVFGEKSLNYVIDMHGIYDERLKDTIGGTDINIHHNTFYTTEDGPIVLHGDPIHPANIHHNIFLGVKAWDKAFTKGIYFKNGKVNANNNLYYNSGTIKDNNLKFSVDDTRILKKIKLYPTIFSIK